MADLHQVPPSAAHVRRPRALLYATLAMTAFAANSLLCRLALRTDAIDPASFTTIRLMAGAIALVLLTSPRRAWAASSLPSAILLAAYALAFSFAYTQLSAGTGALILFGSVQVTMVAAVMRTSERVHMAQWAGLLTALTGLVYLVYPQIATPSFNSAILMAAAGIAWGLYSWRGRTATHALDSTSGNFVAAVPFVLLVSLANLPEAHAAPMGLMLAALSGAVASGLGYIVWYAALRSLTGMEAAVVQLSVPVLTAAGGVILLTERLSARLVVATVIVLGGIVVTGIARERLGRGGVAR